MKFAVIIKFKMNGKEWYDMPSVDIFESLESAQEYLCNTYQEMVNSDKAAGWFDFTASISDDKKRAKITQDFCFGISGITEMEIGQIIDD